MNVTKMRFYWIDPILHIRTKSQLFGFFKFHPCPCGCTKDHGWGFNFFLFGLNIVRGGEHQ